MGEGEAVAVDLVEDDGEEVRFGFELGQIDDEAHFGLLVGLEVLRWVDLWHVALSQNCLRKDGTSAAFSVMIRAGLAHMRQCNT